MARKPYIPSVEEMRLKAIVIEQFDLWKSQGTSAVRNQKRVVSKCPALTEASLSRLLNINDAKCPSLDEAIEILMTMSAAGALNRYIKTTNSVACHYLRSLMKGAEAVDVADTPISNNDKLLVEMNEKLNFAGRKLRYFDKLIYQLQGGVVAASIVAYGIFVNKSVFLG